MSPGAAKRLGLMLAVLAAGIVVGAFRSWRSTDPDEKRGPAPQSDDRRTEELTRRMQVERPPRRPQGYVGSAICANCHAEICQAYARHPMGQSLARIGEASAIEDYDVNVQFTAPSNARSNLKIDYRVERTEEGVWHHETARDPDGKVVYDQAEQVDFVIGSGQRGRSYLINRDGRLFQSPISWYSGTNRWDLSPGYAIQNVRFERLIVDGCIVCHAGRLDTIPHRPNCYGAEPFVEEAIGCERCHGPAEKHVAFHENGSQTTLLDSIVNPSHLEPRLRDSVCLQCHLVGEERITRYGRTDFDFRPGDDVSEIWSIFVLGPSVNVDGTTSAVSQPEQMISSTCYRESGGRLGCTSCHDPHSVPQPEDRAEFYRSRCLNCHNAGATECSLPLPKRTEVTAEDSCIQCHMQRLDTDDVPHTSQTDHRVLRNYDGTSSSPPVTGPVPIRIFGEGNGVTPESELNRAFGIIHQIEASRTGRSDNPLLVQMAIQKLKPWFEAAPEDAAVAEALGIAYLLNHDVNSARETWETALVLHPQDERLLWRLVMLYDDSGEYAQGAEYARRLLAVNPWRHKYFRQLMHMLWQMGQLEDAIEAGKRALEIDPSDAWIHGWLAEIHAIKGNRKQSEQHRRQFEILNPR